VSGPRDPWAVALHDQLGAAFDDVVEMWVAEAVQLKLTGGRPVLAGPAARVLAAFERRDKDGALQWCKHLRPESPQPAVWLAWRPGRLYCGPCMVQLPPLSGREDRRCDACRSVQSKITQCRSMAPGRLLPERTGKPAEARPPVVLMYGLCGRCRARTEAESKRAAAAAPVRFCLPAFGRRLGAEEAASLRTAVEVARHYARGEHEEMVAEATAPGAHLHRVTWGLLVLAMYGLEGVIATAETDPGAARPTFEEVLGRMTEMPARWETHPLIKYPAELTAGARKAAALIRRARAGDRRALSGVAKDARDLTIGGLLLLGSIPALATVAGVASDPEQVWAVMREAIDYWATVTGEDW
jgi:hypothetical protein